MMQDDARWCKMIQDDNIDNGDDDDDDDDDDGTKWQFKEEKRW